MSDTLAVLALDAADLPLVREGECDNFLLSDYGTRMSWLDDDLGACSMRAIVAATGSISETLSEIVFDIREWDRSNTRTDAASDRWIEMYSSHERIRGSGYIGQRYVR